MFLKKIVKNVISMLGYEIRRKKVFRSSNTISQNAISKKHHGFIGDDVVLLLNSSDDMYVKNHKERIILSIEICRKFNFNKRILNVGGGEWGPITQAWQKSFLDAEFIPTDVDLHGKLPYDDDSFDNVIFCEVFEHIGDRNFMSSYKNFEGVINLVSEIIRVMKPGAKMLLTTPNIISYYNIGLALCSTHPFMYPLHYREYSPYEMKTMLDFFGVNTLLLETHDAFSGYHDRLGDTIHKFCIKNGFSVDFRGRHFFIVVEKPEGYALPKIPKDTAHIFYKDNKREKFKNPL